MADELHELRALVERAAPDEVVWEPPPPELWEGIRIATGQSARGRRRTERRRGRWATLAGLAAAAIAIIAVAALVSTRGGSDQVISTGALASPTGGSGSGEAELVDHDGAVRLRLHTAGVDPASGGYLEVWLIDPSISRLVSLGPVRADGVYDVPAGVDPHAYPVVDVSAEAVDGNPAHSGVSVLRGELAFPRTAAT